MITVQGYKNTRDSIMLIFDMKGIDEMIEYLNFIKTHDASMHLNIGNELNNDTKDIDDDMLIIPHLKIINLDRL